MTDKREKPKRWTWDEFLYCNTTSQEEQAYNIQFAKQFFLANQPYLDYLEQRVKELEKKCKTD